MNERVALRLAIQALEDQCRALAFDASIGDRFGVHAPYPEARKASTRRRRYREAIEILKGKLSHAKD